MFCENGPKCACQNERKTEIKGDFTKITSRGGIPIVHQHRSSHTAIGARAIRHTTVHRTVALAGTLIRFRVCRVLSRGTYYNKYSALDIFHAGIKYTEQDWVRFKVPHHPLRV